MKFFGLFVCLAALRHKSTAKAMVGRSVHLTPLFFGMHKQTVNQYFVQILSNVTDNNPSRMIQRREESDHRNYFMIYLNESMGPGQDRTRDP